MSWCVEALEDIVVKHQVDIEVIVVRCNPVLAIDKGEPVPQFKYEMLQLLY